MAYNFVKAQMVPAAQEPIDASNPASGINNIQMQGGVDAGGANSGAPGAEGGVPAAEAKRLLNQVAAAGLKAPEFKGVVEDLYNRVTDPIIQEKVGKLMQALEKNNDPRSQTTDPQTGIKDPTASEMAQQLVMEINEMEKRDRAEESAKAANSKYFNLRESAAAKGKKKKRDSRGNPFKVLMGKVGKLLDHGISKKDIVRFLLKEGHWNEDTVEKAVNLVRDYNKKKRGGSESKKDDTDKQETTASMQKDNTVAKNSFNLKRYAQTSLELDGIYGIQPEWSKRSTAELIMRAAWLLSLQDYDENTRQGDSRKAASKKGVTAQLKDIKKALTERGFDGEELFTNLKRRV
jgi:hypothetical protein